MVFFCLLDLFHSPPPPRRWLSIVTSVLGGACRQARYLFAGIFSVGFLSLSLSLSLFLAFRAISTGLVGWVGGWVGGWGFSFFFVGCFCFVLCWLFCFVFFLFAEAVGVARQCSNNVPFWGALDWSLLLLFFFYFHFFFNFGIALEMLSFFSFFLFFSLLKNTTRACFPGFKCGI